ncbi:MAG: multicopper oxidase domain-containing protein [Coleofasciculus sp. C2-GNP5-27]
MDASTVTSPAVIGNRINHVKDKSPNVYNPFQVISRNGKSEPYPAWTDTVLVPRGETVRIRIPFRDFAGKTVYHCHILDHEDLGMMGNLEIQA